jgi:hypothetical protein
MQRKPAETEGGRRRRRRSFYADVDISFCGSKKNGPGRLSQSPTPSWLAKGGPTTSSSRSILIRTGWHAEVVMPVDSTGTGRAATFLWSGTQGQGLSVAHVNYVKAHATVETVRASSSHQPACRSPFSSSPSARIPDQVVRFLLRPKYLGPV